jgi:hypothetical protein
MVQWDPSDFLNTIGGIEGASSLPYYHSRWATSLEGEDSIEYDPPFAFSQDDIDEYFVGDSSSSGTATVA